MEKCMKDSKRRTSQIGACVLGILLVGLIGSTFLWHKSSDKVTLDEVKLKEVDENSGMFAIMLEKNPGKGDYEQSTDTTWPTEGYTFNDGMSGCLDSDGQKIEDVSLKYETNKIKLETGNTSYCYIYFDKAYPKPGDVVSGKKPAGLSNSTSGGLKRFQGSLAENYICFGITDKCSSQDNHMYRIIGIDGSGRLKIMKETEIEINGSKTIAWDSRPDQDIQWNTAQLKDNLNGSGFLNNSTYIPQNNNNWKTLIDDTIQWKYGDVTNVSTTGTSLYSTEQRWSSSVPASIGLIYLSDYYLSYSDTINCYTDFITCQFSWMHQSRNGDTSNAQWTMSRYGRAGNNYSALSLGTNGDVGWGPLDSTLLVRPVFYLKSDVKITGGDGKIDTPFTITP